jgi:membrane protease subunit HflC
MSPAKMFSLILAAIVLWLGSMSFFIVEERELAVKFQLGEFERADYTPGIYFKLPFINNVRKFDSRILTLDAEPERYLTFEKKNVIVDAFIKWRINDVENYYKTMGGDERRAGMRLSQVIKNGLRDEFGKRTIQEAISGERAEIMSVITEQIEEQAKQFGIKVVDVRIKRIELPPEVSGSVFDRMEAERARVAKDLRSRGAEAAERIERIRGEGDASAAEIYADAFSKDHEFYAFYRSLNAYENVFSKQEDVLVLDPESEFFKYFKSLSGRK